MNPRVQKAEPYEMWFSRILDTVFAHTVVTPTVPVLASPLMEKLALCTPPIIRLRRTANAKNPRSARGCLLQTAIRFANASLRPEADTVTSAVVI